MGRYSSRRYLKPLFILTAALAFVVTPVSQIYAQDMETVNRCDELGANPDDPEAMTAGVADNALDGEAVVEACTKAIAIDNDTPRLKYQLARGLLKVGRDEDALEQLLPAAEAGHGGSLALLGDIHLSGAAGVDADPAAARALYSKAAEAKFEPANAALAKFEDQTEALAQAEAEERQAAQIAAVAPAQSTATRPQAGRIFICNVEFAWHDSSGNVNSYDYTTLKIRYNEASNIARILDGDQPAWKGKRFYYLNKDYPTRIDQYGAVIFKIEGVTENYSEGEFYLYPQSNRMTMAETFDLGVSLFGFKIQSRIFGKGDCTS